MEKQKDHKNPEEFDASSQFDTRVFKESVLKSLEIEKFFKELMKPLSTADLKDISICFFENSMGLIKESKRLKAGGFI